MAGRSGIRRELLHYPPVKIKEARPRSPRYLPQHERIRIADLLAGGATVRGIAAELGRAPSTISREIRRNSDPDGRYRPHHAEHAARLRACKPRARRPAGQQLRSDARGHDDHSCPSVATLTGFSTAAASAAVMAEVVTHVSDLAAG